MDSIIYSDVNLETPTVTDTVENIESIKQNLITLFTIVRGSLPFRRDLGTNLRSLLFSPMTDEIEFALLSELVTTIENFEPRVSVDSQMSSVEANKEEHTYDVVIAYKIKNLNQRFFIEGSFDQGV
jgi:phage baseplate assembly protein W